MLNCHKKTKYFQKKFSKPETTFQVIPVRLKIGSSSDKGVKT